MDRIELLKALQVECPVGQVPYTLPPQTGLVLVDLVNGFCTVGMGPLAPPATDARVDQMVDETEKLARRFVRQNRPVFVFRDSHTPGVPEPPYPPHCERGTGQDELVPMLEWLTQASWDRSKRVSILPKDCINGFVGAIDEDGHNLIVDWVNRNDLSAIVVVGICTDICDSDFVVAMLSARNHGMMPSLKDIVFYEPASATYDLPKEVVASLGFPKTAAHPQEITHHIGLYTMQTRGAIIANVLKD